MNYQRKYLKYKLKYLNIKKMIKRGGTIHNQDLERLNELESQKDFEQDKKLVKIIENEGLNHNIPLKKVNENPTLPHNSAGIGFTSDLEVDMTLAGKPITSIEIPLSSEKIIGVNPTLPHQAISQDSN